MIEGLRRLAAVAATLAAMALSALPAAAESAAASRSTLSAAQLAQLVAPIALYPDPLLGQMLMAATYPLEVAEAARWSKDNPEVSGEALQEAVAGQSWDPSVKALTALPQILQMMSDKGDWTQQLGDAFLAQQADVLTAIQQLRARAEAAGKLDTTPQQKVAKVADPPPAGSSAPPTTVYVIEPGAPDEYSVPIYDPGVVYGTWPYPGYAPFYWYPPGYVAEGSFSFAAGVAVGAAIWGRIDWWQDRVNINVNRYNRFNQTSLRVKSNTWRHDPAHRLGVPYPNPQVAERFAEIAKEAAREQSRPRAEAEEKEKPKQSAKTAKSTKKTAARSKQAKKSTKQKRAAAGTAASRSQAAATDGAATSAKSSGRRGKRRQ